MSTDYAAWARAILAKRKEQRAATHPRPEWMKEREREEE